MNAADLIAAIREHGLTESLVAYYLGLRDDSRGPSADRQRARLLCALAASMPHLPSASRERPLSASGHATPVRALIAASAASPLVRGGA